DGRHGLRAEPPVQALRRGAGGVHGRARRAGRGRVRRAAARGGRSPRASARHGGAQGGGPPARPVEPLPPGSRPRPRADERGVRAARRADRPQPDRARGRQLQRARHGQHGGPHPVRDPGAAGPLAAPAPGRGDPVGVRHDRARRGQLGRHERPAAHRARRGRVRPQRAQVVDDGGAARPLPRVHRHGQDGPGRAAPPPAVDGPRPARHARADRPAQPARLRLHRAGGPRRAAPRGRPRARGEPHRGRGRRLPHQPGAARPRPHPPLHAHDRRRGARARAHVRPRRRAGDLRRARGLAGQRPGLDRRVAHRHRDDPAADPQDGVAHGHGGQPPRADGDRGDQGGRAAGGAAGHRPRDPGPRGRRRLERRAARLHVRARALPAARRRPGRGPQDDDRPPGAAGGPAGRGRPRAGGAGADAL
ncbi:MAG: Acyl-CoA dehydrogenase, partial [uncultured Solirubrobacteraceae bacterium]